MSRRLAVTMMFVGSLVIGACGDDDGGDGEEGNGEPDTSVPDAGAGDAARSDARVPDAATARDAASDAQTDIDSGADDAAVSMDATTDSAIDATAGSDASGDAAGAGDGGNGDAGALAVRPSMAGQIVITEIQAAPLGYADDVLAEWVEIYNPSTTTTYDLGGCVFSDKPADDDYTITGSLLLAPGAYRVITSDNFTVALQGFVGDQRYGSGTGLSGSGDAPVIKCGGVTIDVANYGAAGFPVAETMQGRTLQLSSSSLTAAANDTGSNWCFSNVSFFGTTDANRNYGTPKAANRACP
jgi:hypothetical protein